MRSHSLTRFFFTLLVSLACINTCSEVDIVPEERVNFKKGVLDLSQLQFTEQSVVEMRGEWEFFYNDFHYPPFQGKKELSGYLNVPESWQGMEIKGKKIPRTGHVTLRGFILLNQETVGQELRIYVPDVASSYRMFANGVLLGGQGKPGINRFDDIPKIQVKYFTLIPDSQIIEIVFHISNFENNFGGFWGIPMIGNKYAIDRERLITTARELFLLGAVLIIGFYHWGLYFYRRKEKSILYFALLCIFLGLRIAFTGNRYIFDLYPNFPWQLAFRIEFAAYYLAIPIFILFIGNLFPLDANQKLIKWILYISLLFVLTLFLPVAIFTILLSGFQFVAFFTIAYVIRVNAKAVSNSRPNSKLFLMGLIILAVFVSYDIISHSLNINDQRVSLTPYGLLIFIFFQSLILSSRIASSFTRAEELAESLKISNESLKALTENLEFMVLDRTSQLNSTLQRLRKDLQLAKKIQQKILPTTDLKIPKIKFHLHFLPKDEVGGDFYDVFELDSGIIRFFLADATGHGIQAALYTMAIKSEYEAIKRFVTKTDDLMNHLNQKVQNKFSGLKIVFSCFLIDIDTRTNKLYYTSAGHPDQILVTKKAGLELLPRTGNIIGLRKEQEYTQYSTHIESGDRIFLFTDGIVEQKNTNREEYTLERIVFRMDSYRDKPGEDFLKDIIQDLEVFQGSVPQEDDLTLLLIECT
ncbi:protein phosphatase [Leptospira ognonensis]|uniref:Protein phosphatase n=1 Tax=Leptospira ognonensis TaxID=2484945 RepID=A0A4R9KDJ9_9LEPT|nr:protein phosphatase [Leptospira ognonensis]